MSYNEDALNQLLTAIDALPDEVVGNHLTDEDFKSYGRSNMSEARIEELDRHLDSCEVCATRLEVHLESRAETPGITPPSFQDAALLADIDQLPDGPVGPHPSNQRLDAYVAGKLARAEERAEDLHFDSCEICARKLERWLQKSSVPAPAFRWAQLAAAMLICCLPGLALSYLGYQHLDNARSAEIVAEGLVAEANLVTEQANRTNEEVDRAKKEWERDYARRQALSEAATTRNVPSSAVQTSQALPPRDHKAEGQWAKALQEREARLERRMHEEQLKLAAERQSLEEQSQAAIAKSKRFDQMIGEINRNGSVQAQDQLRAEEAYGVLAKVRIVLSQSLRHTDPQALRYDLNAQLQTIDSLLESEKQTTQISSIQRSGSGGPI